MTTCNYPSCDFEMPTKTTFITLAPDGRELEETTVVDLDAYREHLITAHPGIAAPRA